MEAQLEASALEQMKVDVKYAGAKLIVTWYRHHIQVVHLKAQYEHHGGQDAYERHLKKAEHKRLMDCHVTDASGRSASSKSFRKKKKKKKESKKERLRRTSLELAKRSPAKLVGGKWTTSMSNIGAVTTEEKGEALGLEDTQTIDTKDDDNNDNNEGDGGDDKSSDDFDEDDFFEFGLTIKTIEDHMEELRQAQMIALKAFSVCRKKLNNMSDDPDGGATGLPAMLQTVMTEAKASKEYMASTRSETVEKLTAMKKVSNTTSTKTFRILDGLVQQIQTLSDQEIGHVQREGATVNTRLTALTDMLVTHFGLIDSSVNSTESELSKSMREARAELNARLDDMQQRQAAFEATVVTRFVGLQAAMDARFDQVLQVLGEINGSRAGRDQRLADIYARIPPDPATTLANIETGVRVIPQHIAEYLAALGDGSVGRGASGGGGGVF